MPLTQQQITALLAAALPGAQISESRQADPARYDLRLTGGERLQVLLYATPAQAGVAAQALRLLADEFDLPLPQLRGEFAVHELAGLLVSGAEGERLPEVQASITGEQLYAIGQRLGETASRIHRIAAPQWGPLVGAGHPNAASYANERLEAALVAAMRLGLINNLFASELRTFCQGLSLIERPPALVHGGLAPGHLVVRRSAEGWKLGALLGWEHAVGWSPAWEHVVWWENTDATRDFALRVGYGNAYDERTQRSYEQVRELAMRREQTIRLLELLAEHTSTADTSAADQTRLRLVYLAQSSKHETSSELP